MCIRDSNIFRIGRRISVKSNSIEHIPRRHLAGIIHPCIRQLVGTHVIVVVHQAVETALGFLLFVYEIIGVRNAVSRLVSVAIVSDESGQVVGLVTSPRRCV